MNYEQYYHRVINHLDIEHGGPLPYHLFLKESDKYIIQGCWSIGASVIQCANFLNQRKAVGL